MTIAKCGGIAVNCGGIAEAKPPPQVGFPQFVPNSKELGTDELRKRHPDRRRIAEELRKNCGILVISRPPYRDPSLPPLPPVDAPMTQQWRCPTCQRHNWQHCHYCPHCGEPKPERKEK